MARGAVFVVVSAACARSPEPASVADLTSKLLTLTVTADGTQVAVTVDNVPVDDVVPDCVVLRTDVTATLDGMPMQWVSRGSGAPGSCELPTAQITTTPVVPRTTVSEIVLSDGTTSLTVIVPGLRAPRAFSVGAVQAGTAATFTWSVPSDTPPDLQFSNPNTGNPPVWWTPVSGPGFNVDEVSVTGTTEVANIPSTATTGAGQFGFSPIFAPHLAGCGLSICLSVAPTPPAIATTISP